MIEINKTQNKQGQF